MKIGGMKINTGKRAASSSSFTLSSKSSTIGLASEKGVEGPSLKKSKNLQEKKQENTTEGNGVKITLWNFNGREELMEKMIKLKRHWVEERKVPNSGFKYQYDCVATIDGSVFNDQVKGNCLFTNPYDVKISHTHEVIIVLDNILERLVFFDVNSLEFYSMLEIKGEPTSLALELEYCESGTDALYVSFPDKGRLVKYDLESLLELSGEGQDLSACQVWIQDNFDYPYSTTISYGSKTYNEKHHFSENTVYVCDSESGCIAILEAVTGEPITMIDLNLNGRLQSIDFLNDRQLVVSLYENIIILEKNRHGNDWKSVQKFENVSCTYLICDRNVGKILCATKSGLVVLDVKSGTMEVKLLGRNVNSLALDGSYLYYALIDKKIDIYE